MRRLSLSLAMLLVPAVAFAAGSGSPRDGMPQLNFSTYASQLFWLAVFFMLFYLFMWLFAMPRVGRILDERQARLSSDLGHATAASAEVDRLRAALDQSLAAAREQARAALAHAVEDIRARNAEQDEKLSTELAHRIDTAEAAISASLNAALGSIDSIATAIVDETLQRLAGITIGHDEAAAAVRHLNLVRG